MPEYHIPKDPNCFGDVSVQFFGCFLVGETHGNCCTSMTSSNHYVSDYLTASRPLLHRQISQICIVNILPTSKLIICKNLWEFLDFWIGYWIYTSPNIFEHTWEIWINVSPASSRKMGSPPGIQRCVGELRSLGLRRVPSWSNGHFFTGVPGT